MKHKIIETREIWLDHLVLDPETQVRDKTQSQIVKRYGDAMRAGKEFPPVTVGRIMDGDTLMSFTLIDGWHRTQAAKIIGKTHILADIVDARPEEYRWIASEANMSHGVALSRAEKRTAFRAYVKANQHKRGTRRVKSAREISRDLHGSPSDKTISDWMRADFPAIYRKMSLGGLLGEDAERNRPDRNLIHHDLAKDALMQFWANFRSVGDKEMRASLLQEITRIAKDTAVTVTGNEKLPEIILPEVVEYEF